jgi:hypothetical protein
LEGLKAALDPEGSSPVGALSVPAVHFGLAALHVSFQSRRIDGVDLHLILTLHFNDLKKSLLGPINYVPEWLIVRDLALTRLEARSFS